MTENTIFAWGALLLLGALHGANPGMGWLFAVALGLQERSGRAVWRSLLPLAAGHALAVATAVAVLVVAGRSLPPDALRWGVAALLAVMGVLHLRGRLHPRFGGMQVKRRDLVVWSFLMASAHGAGVMALAFVPAAVHAAEPAAEPAAAQHVHEDEARSVPGPHAAAVAGAHGVHGAHGAHGAHGSHAADSGALGVLATLVHTLGYLLTMGLVATLVYYRFGLRLLRRAWINIDVIWAGALIATAVLIPLL